MGKVIRTDEERTRLWKIWHLMIFRCYIAEKGASYYYYREKGIKVCDEWRDNFAAFKEWSMKHGYREVYVGRKNSSSIDRINPDGDYEPNNCQWITRSENCSRARRPAVYIKTQQPRIIQVTKPNGTRLVPVKRKSGLGVNRYIDHIYEKYGSEVKIQVFDDSWQALHECGTHDYAQYLRIAGLKRKQKAAKA